MTTEIKVTVTYSSHPDFEFFASASAGSRQITATRSRYRGGINYWINDVREAAARHGLVVVVEDETLD